MEQFDYIIIGAGSAGCVLANRLTADGRFSVCILEAGPSDWDPFIHIPAGFMKTLFFVKLPRLPLGAKEKQNMVVELLEAPLRHLKVLGDCLV